MGKYFSFFFIFLILLNKHLITIFGCSSCKYFFITFQKYLFMFHSYSDDTLVDVVAVDYTSKKSNGSILYDDFVSSCPCIDSLCIETQKCVMTPLLMGKY